MDFMFEDEADEVGSDVEAYCPKCKADTTHVVISKYEEEIRRVQCNPCGDVHSYRKPRGETEDEVPEPVSAKKRAALKKLNWDEFFAKKSQNDAKPYEFRERYKENLIVRHPKFGVGFVSEVVSDSKVEITFQDARRILVHNRKDIPGLPLAAEGDGMPTPPKSAKPAKEPAAKGGAKDAGKDTGKEGGKDAQAGAKPGKPGKDAGGKEAVKDGVSKAPTLKLVPGTGPSAKAPAAEAKSEGKDAKGEGKGGKVDSKAKPEVKPTAKTESKPAAKVEKAKPAAKAPVKVAAKSSVAKSSKVAPKAAAPRGGKTAAKPAAKKPAPRPKKKAGKKR
ncbi:MAG TPA: hypothetical protein VGG33_01850 [Polyangia bacterium]